MLTERFTPSLLSHSASFSLASSFCAIFPLNVFMFSMFSYFMFAFKSQSPAMCTDRRVTEF